MGQKKYAEAEPLLVAGATGVLCEAANVSPEKVLRPAINRLVAYYEATSRKDDAAKWRKELDAIPAAGQKK